jgi:chaperonin cofactor prefoldin
MENYQLKQYEDIPTQQYVTQRQRLGVRRQQIQAELSLVEKAIAALDAHPELEDFIETMRKAGV